ncbi:MAG: RNA polymerase factor sigma-54 [Bdellovibrionales bacterium]|nr:RNA polymerase factor sigma-54 [Bdellovibrionales bacterium]
MALEAKLVQKLSQSLLMTPQLQQAIKLLQLGRLEYIEAIQQELLENPVLEELKEEEGSREGESQEERNGNRNEKETQDSLKSANESSADQSPVAWEDYLESFQDYRGAASPKGLSDFDDRPSVENTLTKGETLREYLVSQIRMAELEPNDQTVVVNVLGNLDRNGLLCCSYEEIAEEARTTVDHVAQVVGSLSELDPPGVFARNVGECLLFQLEALGKGESLEARIVIHHLDKLERRKYDAIAKEEGVTVEQVYEAVKAIQTLEPRPGRQFADEETRYITPDIYVYKVGGEYVISLNEDGMPRLRVSPYYLDILKRSGEENEPNRAYLNDKLKAASWLIKSIHQRQQTIYKVTESIVKHQREFFDYGIEKLKPLVLKDIADDIGMHESTVSRVTTNKYVHTPQGVFELKFFFSTAIKTANGDVSSSSVKERIKQIIGEEDASNPISDQRIVELLGEENVQIARRTVAKYRESLGILSSSKRKKLF